MERRIRNLLAVAGAAAGVSIALGGIALAASGGAASAGTLGATGDQSAFSEVVTAVYSELPDGYVYSEWAADGGRIVVTPAAATAAEAIVTRYPIAVTIEVADAPIIGDQDQLALAVIEALQATGTQRPMAVRYDVTEDAIVITLWENGDPVAEYEIAQATQIGTDFAAPINAGVRVEVDLGDAPTFR